MTERITMFISPTNAIKMYDVSKPTLYKDMSEGKLSYTKDDRKRRKINVAELDRIYQKRQAVEEDLTLDNVKEITDFTEANVKNKQVTSQVKAIREQIEKSKGREVELLEQQIEQYKDQVENLNRHLEETREEHRVYVRLLEDKREEQGAKTTNWEGKLQLLEQQINALQLQNQQLIIREEERKKRIEERRQRKEAEKKAAPPQKSSFFERFFG